MIKADEFLEYANVFGNYYGTARRFLREAEQKGHDLLLDIDVQGAAQIKQKCPEPSSIFVLPPDRKTLEWRLRKRSEDDEATIQRRLATATREIENYDKYDYILINDDLRSRSKRSRHRSRLRQSERPLTAEEKADRRSGGALPARQRPASGCSPSWTRLASAVPPASA